MCRTAVLFISLLSIISPIFAQNIHGNRNHYAEYGPNGDFIAIGGEDIILLNSENQEIRVVNVDSPEGYTLAFSPDGSLLAAETLSKDSKKSDKAEKPKTDSKTKTAKSE